MLYRADPPDACERLDFHRNTTGAAFALVERGNCVFDIKVGYAQLAGFSAIIVYNNDLGRELITSEFLPSSYKELTTRILSSNSKRPSCPMTFLTRISLDLANLAFANEEYIRPETVQKDILRFLWGCEVNSSSQEASITDSCLTFGRVVDSCPY